MKSDFNHRLTGDDLLMVVKKGIGSKQFFVLASKGGRPPETEVVSNRLARAWNAMQGLSDAELEQLEPGAVKRLLGTPVAPVVIDVTDYKIVEVAETTS